MIYTVIEEGTIILPKVEREDCIRLPGNETLIVPITPGGDGGRILATQDGKDVLTQGGNTIGLQ